jgi:hypothetical protein
MKLFISTLWWKDCSGGTGRILPEYPGSILPLPKPLVEFLVPQKGDSIARPGLGIAAKEPLGLQTSDVSAGLSNRNAQCYGQL